MMDKVFTDEEREYVSNEEIMRKMQATRFLYLESEKIVAISGTHNEGKRLIETLIDHIGGQKDRETANYLLRKLV